MGSLELKNIYACYNKNKVIEDFSLCINKGSNITILGGVGSGKSTLTEILAGNFKYDGLYKINGVEIVKSNAYLIKRYVEVIESKKIDNNHKVVDVLFDALDGKDYDSLKEEKLVKSIVKQFDLGAYLEYRVNSLDYNMRFYILIIAGLLKKRDYLVLDDVLCRLNNDQKQKIFVYAKKNKISIINFTTRTDEALYSDYLILLYNHKVAMEGETIACLKEEQILKRLGFNLPFMIDLSIQLNYYEIIDDIYLDQDEMVSKIWN
jgi:putative ABC transport system ATP-binding protein